MKTKTNPPKPLSEKQKADRRVLIAQDVLKLLKKKKTVKVMSGNAYLDLTNAVPEADEKKELSKLLPKLITPKKPCTVCALGACFLAHVTRYNNLVVPYSLSGQGGASLFGSVAREQLSDVFDLIQLGDIEGYFESFWGSQDIADDRARLVAIMKNIIANKGTFVDPRELAATEG